ncbi:MAG: T9SS type A sorting domain-containing protein [Bacteroidia bacterium]
MKKILMLLMAVAFVAAEAQAQTYPLVSIDSIQWVHPDSLANGYTLSRYQGDTVRIRGLVIFNPRNHALSTSGAWKGTYLVDTAGYATNNWKGLLVRLPAIGDSSVTNFFNNFQPGNIVECTGVVQEFQDASAISGETQLDLIPVATQVVGFAAPPLPKTLQISTFMQFDPFDPAVPQKIQISTGEQYEGMYVEIPNVFVTGVNTFGGGRISWLVRDASGSEMNVRDVSVFFRPPNISSTASNPPNPFAPVFVQQGKAFAHIRGIITETNFGTLYPRYEIVPLIPSDLGPVTASPPFTSMIRINPTVPETNSAVTIGAKVEDLDGSVSTVRLFYAVGLTNNIYDSVPMTVAAVDSFVGVIPGSALTQNNEYVKYFIKAIDNDNNVSITPDTTFTYSVFRIVNGGINTISQIQETPFASGRSIYDGQIIDGLNIRGRIMSTLSTTDYGRIAFQDGLGPMSGIMLRPDNFGTTDIDVRQRGDSIQITRALVVEDFGITTLEVLAYNFISAGNPYPPVNIPIDSVIARVYNYTEGYESMLIEFEDVFVVNQNPDAPSNFGEFSIYPDSLATSGLRVRGGVNLSSMDLGQNFNIDSLTAGQKLDFIRGILTFNFANWKLQPRNRNDVHGFQTQTGPGTSVAELNSNGRVNRLYPNPNNGNFMVELQLERPEMIQLEIFDLAGKRLYHKRVNGLQGMETLQIEQSELPAGMYFLRLSGQESAHHSRFVVRK